MTPFHTKAEYGPKLSDAFSENFGSAPQHGLNWVSRRQIVQGIATMAIASVAPASVRAQVAIPTPLDVNLVQANRSSWNGRQCLAIELTGAEQAKLVEQRGGNGPSYAVVARDFSNGVIEVDVGAELTGKGAPDSRGFVGLAFHIDPASPSYEAVYIRMTNGRSNRPAPPSPRIDRAIQYVADPDFHFNVSRERFPGRYEKGADVELGRWRQLRLEIAGAKARALICQSAPDRDPG